jgi:hypothetical protein
MAEELCAPDVGGRLIGLTALAPRYAQMQFVITRHRGAPGTLIIERRSKRRSSHVEGVQQLAGPKYAKVGFESIHWQRDIGDLSPGGVAVAPYFLFSLSFSCRRLLPQLHTHGCHMNAMLKLCDHLAAPTAPISQDGSPGIWLPDLFGHLFSRTTFPIKVMGLGGLCAVPLV